MVTMCPTQQKWFGLFVQGAENRMGYCSQLGPGVINKLLRAIKEEIEEQNAWIAREYVKVGAAAALAVWASLQGPEIFLLDLAGLWMYQDLGKNGWNTTGGPSQDRGGSLPVTLHYRNPNWQI